MLMQTLKEKAFRNALCIRSPKGETINDIVALLRDPVKVSGRARDRFVELLEYWEVSLELLKFLQFQDLLILVESNNVFTIIPYSDDLVDEEKDEASPDLVIARMLTSLYPEVSTALTFEGEGVSGFIMGSTVC